MKRGHDRVREETDLTENRGKRGVGGGRGALLVDG